MIAPVVVASLVRCCVVCAGQRHTVLVPMGGDPVEVPCLHCADRVPIVVVPWRDDTRRGAA